MQMEVKTRSHGGEWVLIQCLVSSHEKRLRPVHIEETQGVAPEAGCRDGGDVSTCPGAEEPTAARSL